LNDLDGVQFLFTSLAANSKGFFTDATVLAGTTYCYKAFHKNDLGTFVGGRQVTATPFTPATVAWRFYTGATAVSPPGIGPGAAYVVSNDNGLYAVTRGTSGGLWPGAWWPLRFGAPIQSRVGVPPLSLTIGALNTSNALFVGEQPPGQGRVFAVDADRGMLAGGVAWDSAQLAEGFQGAMGGLFAIFGAPGDFVLAGTRNSGSPNRLYALQVADGQLASLGLFDNGGTLSTQIGVINSGPSVQYGTPTSRVYFSSNVAGGGSPHSLWCLNVTSSGLDTVPCGTRDLGSLDAGPTLRGGRVYVGDTAGRVFAFDSTLATEHWSVTAGAGAIKGFVALDRESQDLFAVGGNQIAGLTDNLGSAVNKPGFPISTIVTPSIPVFVRIAGTPYLYVGDGSGRLCQIDTNLGTSGVTCTTLQAGTQLGAPTFDALNGMIYVGSTTGTIFGVRVPF
jgi:outer membrane protein assembly factor BamB